jgi:hypothetical protein
MPFTSCYEFILIGRGYNCVTRFLKKLFTFLHHLKVVASA